MLRAAIVFFVIGLVAFFLGMNGVAGMSVELGKLLLGVFVALAVVGLLVSLVTGRRIGGGHPPLP
jgi:uncharacterized membrane protein YtjA (UPF0391 family)